MKDKFKHVVFLLWGVFFILHPCVGQNKQTTHTKYLLLNDQVIEQVENAKLYAFQIKSEN